MTVSKLERARRDAERDAARARLRRRLPVGSVVYVTQHHVSRSGMLRHLSLSIIRNGHHVDITCEAAAAMGDTVSHTYGYPTIKVGGCGMDMHFHLVYSLARSLRPDGHLCTGHDSGPRRCPSNDHTNDWGRLAREYAETHPGHADEYTGSDDAAHYVAARSAWIKAQPTHDRKRRHSDGGYTLTRRSV